jgi:hypothetical protein
MNDNKKSEKICRFICNNCQYITDDSYDYKKHVLTLKHVNNTEITTNDNKKSENICQITKEKTDKIKQFSCEKCKYITNDKHDYKKHLMTRKHNKLNSITTHKESNQYLCHCGKSYKYMSGLCIHKKKCNDTINNNNNNNEIKNLNNNIDNNIILELVKQNQSLIIDNNEFKKMIIEQNDKIIELSKSTNITNNNNCHNKTKFNMNFFLNEQCKDALNIMDFVNDLQVKLTDLENVGKLGYSEGISKIFINGLKQLDVFKRPIHCSDLKREVLYIKDKDLWEKENEDNKKIKNAINHISHKNINQIPKWLETNPNCNDSHSTQNNDYLQIVSESMGSIEQSNINKIIHNIAKEVVIDKE